MIRLARIAAVLGLAAVGTACGNKVVQIQLNVVDQTCSGGDPLGNGASHVKFTVTGDGIQSPIIAVFPLTQQKGSIPQIPAGNNRVIEVRAYAGDPTNGSANLVSIGRSVPFTVPTDTKNPVPVTIFLRVVNGFTKPNLASSPTTCSTMTIPRAGHTATVLKDGTVFIAGGFEFQDGGTVTSSTLGEAVDQETTEIYDPSTGEFDAGKPMRVALGNGKASELPRAFHTANLLPSGQVLLVGGEHYRDGAQTPLEGAMVYDPVSQSYVGLQLNQPHTRHAVALDNNGRALIVGGYTTGGQVADMVEWFDPSSPAWQIPLPASFIAGSSTCKATQDAGPCLSFPRVGMGVAPVQSGQVIAIAGGFDGSQLVNTVSFFEYSGTSFALSQAPPATLSVAKTEVSVALVQDPNLIAVAGGFQDMDAGVATAQVDLVQTTSPPKTVNTSQLATGRADICSAVLAGGGVLTSGGRTAGGSSATVELITVDSGGNATVLAQAPLQTTRYAHTCTTLLDGSVLILGGINDASGVQNVLQDAIIYMPQPANP